MAANVLTMLYEKLLKTVNPDVREFANSNIRIRLAEGDVPHKFKLVIMSKDGTHWLADGMDIGFNELRGMIPKEDWVVVANSIIEVCKQVKIAAYPRTNPKDIKGQARRV